MTSDRWERLDRIFVVALRRQPDARGAFVLEACGDDEALRDEVQSLLTATEASGEFMAVPAFERLAQHVAVHGYALTPGERVGPYTVLSLLGAGGETRDLGHVWSPDGRRLAYRPDVEDRRRLSIIAADGSGPLRISPARRHSVSQLTGRPTAAS